MKNPNTPKIKTAEQNGHGIITAVFNDNATPADYIRVLQKHHNAMNKDRNKDTFQSISLEIQFSNVLQLGNFVNFLSNLYISLKNRERIDSYDLTGKDLTEKQIKDFKDTIDVFSQEWNHASIEDFLLTAATVIQKHDINAKISGTFKITYELRLRAINFNQHSRMDMISLSPEFVVGSQIYSNIIAC